MELIGNDKVRDILKQIISSNKIAHSYIFYGKQGIGKKAFAKAFAKKILCLNKTEECNSCKSCIQFEGENLPDFNIITPDGKSIKIDQIRNFLEKVYEKPIVSDRKVYIIDDADLMTKEAQNCLLKTLEEPPSFDTIILIVSNENKLLNTIKSRCITIPFSDLTYEDLNKYIKNNNLSIENKKIVSRSNGSIKKMIHILENEELYTKIDNIIDNLYSSSLIDILNNTEIFTKNKDIINDILEYIIVIFYEKLQNCKDYEQDVKYINIIKIVEDTKQKILQNGNIDMCIDGMFMRII